MKNFLLSAFKTNVELIAFARDHAPSFNDVTRRSSVKIAVIDDQPFLAQTNLRSYGYSVEQIGDVKSVDEVKNYHIILCDVMGVGRHFDARNQGATIISEIKKFFPEKIVFAYTGGSTTDPAVRAARDRADGLIKKDADGEEWTAQLDKVSKEATDPHIMWNKIRRRFIELDVDTKHIIILEDAYVRSILQKKGFEYLSHVLSNLNVNADVRAIVQGLASSAIFAIFSR